MAAFQQSVGCLGFSQLGQPCRMQDVRSLEVLGHGQGRLKVYDVISRLDLSGQQVSKTTATAGFTRSNRQ